MPVGPGDGVCYLSFDENPSSHFCSNCNGNVVHAGKSYSNTQQNAAMSRKIDQIARDIEYFEYINRTLLIFKLNAS